MIKTGFDERDHRFTTAEVRLTTLTRNQEEIKKDVKELQQDLVVVFDDLKDLKRGQAEISARLDNIAVGYRMEIKELKKRLQAVEERLGMR